MNTLGERLKYARERKGLTQSALAALSGASQQSVNMAESGKARRPRSLHEMAKTLGVSVDWLLSGRDGGFAPAAAPALSQVAEGDDSSHVAALSPPGQKLPVFGLQPSKHPGVYSRSSTPVDLVARPAALAGIPHAFAVSVHDRVMAPRYEPGDILLAHPGKPVTEGDYALLTLSPAYAQEGDSIIGRVCEADERRITISFTGVPDAQPFDLYRSRLSGICKIIGLYHK